jgi:hypothetical protein
MRLGLGVACAALLAVSGGGVADAASTGKVAAAARATCATTRPRTFVVSPADAEAGGTTRLLLWCREPDLLGFDGSFGPVAMLIYSRASFAHLHDVNGYVTPVGGASVPAIQPNYDVLGPNDLWIALPNSMKKGTYVVLVDDGKGDVRAQNLLRVR